jgi:hypothetical protein
MQGEHDASCSNQEALAATIPGCRRAVVDREKQIGGSGGSLAPPGPLLTHLLTHLHTVYMAYSECLPTRLNPLAERSCFSQVVEGGGAFAFGEVPEAGLDEGLLSLFLPILVYMENPYKRNK